MLGIFSDKTSIFETCTSMSGMPVMSGTKLRHMYHVLYPRCYTDAVIPLFKRRLMACESNLSSDFAPDLQLAHRDPRLAS
jgi:hypothetical protein